MKGLPTVEVPFDQILHDIYFSYPRLNFIFFYSSHWWVPQQYLSNRPDMEAPAHTQ